MNSICNLKFHVPNEILVAFHNGSNYDYHFTIKELANKFEGQFQCIEENKEKYKTFSVPIKKEIIETDKDGNKTDESLTCKIKFTDSGRFMVSSLSNLVDNLTEEIQIINCVIVFCNMNVSRVI